MDSSIKRRINKDDRVRKRFCKTEFKWMIMKYNMSLYFLNDKFKNYVFFKYMKRFHVNSSMCRINSVCIISGRAHWVLRRFRMSRMTFHQLADFGVINGVRRSSW
jgi:ribosomal protein S14